MKTAKRRKLSRSSQQIQQLHRQLRNEAKSLGLSESEYLNLLVRLSTSVRSNFPQFAGKDVRNAITWVQHPMFPLVVQWVSSAVTNMFSQGSKDESAESDSQSATSGPSNPGPEAQPSPAQPQYPFGQPQYQPGLQHPSLRQQSSQTPPQNMPSRNPASGAPWYYFG